MRALQGAVRHHVTSGRGATASSCLVLHQNSRVTACVRLQQPFDWSPKETYRMMRIMCVCNCFRNVFTRQIAIISAPAERHNQLILELAEDSHERLRAVYPLAKENQRWQNYFGIIDCPCVIVDLYQFVSELPKPRKGFEGFSYPSPQVSVVVGRSEITWTMWPPDLWDSSSHSMEQACTLFSQVWR